VADPYARILDYCADIWVALKGIGAELDAWNRQPRSGTIYINGVPSMTTTDTPTDIPTDDCPAVVDWQDRLGTSIQHDKTQTSWSAEDGTGSTSSAVTVNPNADQDSDDETATVHFLVGTGQFKIVAVTQGDAGPVRAESALYNIVPGAPVVGTITVG
jgi:hypothetical protein